MPTKTTPKHYDKTFLSLIGKTIQNIRHLNKEELEAMGWEWESPEDSTCIIFTDGTLAVLMQDPEGNGSGYMDVIQ